MNLVGLTALAFCAVAPAGDHAGAVSAARADLLDARRVGPLARPYTRYLDFSDLPAGRLPNAIKVLSGHVNQLSRNARVVLPHMVNGTLMRLNLQDYHWKRDVWERLAEADPYFHVKLVKEEKDEYAWPGGVWHEDGKYYPPGAFRCRARGPVKKTVGAVQLHTPQEVIGLTAGKLREEDTAIGQLILETQSQAPVLDALWFFQQTVTDLDRSPGYHDFLGFDSQKEFEELLGFKEVDSRKFSDLWREAVARSGVIQGKRARRIEVFDKPGGYLWRTKDSQLTRDRNNPLRVLEDDLLFDATEQLGPLPNGMMAWGLFNAKGVRQDRAPDTIAGTQRGAANTTMVLNCITCIDCHANAGLKDFTPWARRLFSPPRGLESPDYEAFVRLSRQYLDPLEDNIEGTRARYARAILRSTGFTPQEWSRECYGLWTYYVAAEVDVDWAARSCGVSVPVFQEALQRIKQRTGIIDPVLATFLRPPAESIAIDAWEEVFPVAQSYLRGFVP